MNKEKRENIARKTTIKIFEAILEEHNGYTPEEIKKDKLAEECEGHSLWTRIYDVVYSNIGKK